MYLFQIINRNCFSTFEGWGKIAAPDDKKSKLAGTWSTLHRNKISVNHGQTHVVYDAQV